MKTQLNKAIADCERCGINPNTLFIDSLSMWALHKEFGITDSYTLSYKNKMYRLVFISQQLGILAGFLP